MSEPFLSEIRIFSFNFPPKGWALCNGQILPINQNQALFSLLGTNYGGNGQTNFALPNLQARVPIHFNGAHPLGQQGGEAVHTLSISELPMHTHTLRAVSNPATAAIPDSTMYLAREANAYHAATSPVTMAPAALGPIGGSQPHVNMQPYLVLNFCIALQGIFPSQN